MDQVNAGELRIEFRNVSVYGSASRRAAQAAYAARLQNQFVQYHDALFAGGQIRGDSGLSEDSLVSLAAELGLDLERFTTDMNSEATAAATEKNEELSVQVGAFSTPSFVFGSECSKHRDG